MDGIQLYFRYLFFLSVESFSQIFFSPEILTVEVSACVIFIDLTSRIPLIGMSCVDFKVIEIESYTLLKGIFP